MNQLLNLLILAFLTSSSFVLNAQYTEYGKAAYYADYLHGRPTSSGELYDKNKLTCAHRALPIGSVIEITRMDNLQSVRVTVNDCMPPQKDRIVDLSRAAADRIGLTRIGVAEVKLELIKMGKGKAPCGSSLQPISYSETPTGLVDLTSRGTAPAQPAVPSLFGTYRLEILYPINTGFSVQVGSFSEFSNAAAKGEELRAKGFRDVLIHIERGTNTPVYKVMLGLFPDQATADTYQDNLNKKYKIKGFVVDLSKG